MYQFWRLTIMCIVSIGIDAYSPINIVIFVVTISLINHYI